MRFACASCREKSIGMIQKSMAGKFWPIACKNCDAKLVREITGVWLIWMMAAHIVVPGLLLLLVFFPQSWPLALRICLMICILFITAVIDGLVSTLKVKE